MPFGNYDPSGEGFQEFKQKKIKVIVLLAEDEECKQKAQIPGLSGKEAINWVRQYIGGAVETDEQKQLILLQDGFH